MVAEQLDLLRTSDTVAPVGRFLRDLLKQHVRRPSAFELVREVEERLGVEARWDIATVLSELADGEELTRADRDYAASLLETLGLALRGWDTPDREAISTIDTLLQKSRAYRSSAAFGEMIEFMGRFRDYAPYNNMLVKLQNPACGFYATAKDWAKRFDRTIKEDARPLLILAPMHPVMLVYDLDQTEGKALPKELLEFSQFKGEWDNWWLDHLLENAAGHRIRVDFKPLSQTLSGFATMHRASGDWKMRVAIHDDLDAPRRFGVLCHELAHILLGHLGGDRDHWWPGRSNITRATAEIEAESVAFIVSTRFGLMGSSAAYVSRYLPAGETPAGISVDSIAKVAGYIERMARESMPPRRPRALARHGRGG